MRARWLLVIPVLFAAGATVEASRVPGDGPMIDSSATAMVPAVRGRQVPEQSIPPPPSTVPGPPQPTPGDCNSWADVLTWYDGTPEEVAFFVPRILTRESGCGRDMLNEATGDSGPCQINPVHNRAGYFGRVRYGPGGWLEALHGLRTRQDLYNLEWANACLTLYRVCGPGAWTPPYSCADRRYP